MTSTADKNTCVTCKKEKLTYPCEGCSKRFCLDDLLKHRKDLSQELEHLQNDHDQLRQHLNDQKSNRTKHSLIEQIDRWEIDSITKIKQTAQQCREKWVNYSHAFLLGIEKNLNDIAEQVKRMNGENEFNETDLNRLKQRLEKLQNELHQPTNAAINEQSTSYINKISLRVLLQKETHWKRSGVTIAGGKGQGNRLDQFFRPGGMFLDDLNETIYIADCANDRIVEWKLNATESRIVAGGNKEGNRVDQLNGPTDVILDRENNSLIIADRFNRRVMRWSRENSSCGQNIISNIDCRGLALHRDGSLYVSDYKKNEVRRWKKGETQGTIVAGGNGQGNQRNQLHGPTYLLVTDDHTVYVSDTDNHRIMKWIKGAKEGIVVAGGNGQGNQMKQLSSPRGLILDQFGDIYVADFDNHRVMRWSEQGKEGTVVAGGNGNGQEPDQLQGPVSLFVNDKASLFVADCFNHRIQKYDIE